MKKRLLSKLFKVMFCLCIAQLAVFSEWKLIGLDGHIVNRIVIDYQNRVIAGTDKGVYIYNNTDWLEIYKLLPAQDMIITGPEAGATRFVAAIGNGSNSDGLYSGDTISGPPYYKLSLIDWMIFPQSVTYEGVISNTPYICIGGRNTIQKSLFDFSSGKFKKLSPIKTPAGCFGTVNPRCAALHVFSGDQKLYAGGYDVGSEPGAGHLLWNINQDSMAILKKINVSSLTEGFSELGGKQLCIGTIDSGIYYSTAAMSSPPVKLCTTPNNEPVSDMIVLPSLIMSDILCIAVKSGVYLRNGNSWQEAGNIPEEPRCLIRAQDSSSIIGYVLYAGTAKGVYLYVSATDRINDYQTENVTDINTMVITSKQYGSVSITFFMKKPQEITVDVINPAGKVIVMPVRSYCTAGRNSLTVDLKTGKRASPRSGLYILRVTTGEKQIFRKLLLAK